MTKLAPIVSYFTRNAESVKNFFKLIANPANLPISYHCRIGTDRTGMLTILTLGLLGVPMNDIYKRLLILQLWKNRRKKRHWTKCWARQHSSLYCIY